MILDLKDIVELVVAPVHCEESVAYLALSRNDKVVWPLRFEAKHSFFRQTGHTKCFKNITLSLVNEHQMMIGYHMHIKSFKRSSFDVTHVSTVPVDVMKKDITLHLSRKYPGLTNITLAQTVSSNGIDQWFPTWVARPP